MSEHRTAPCAGNPRRPSRGTLLPFPVSSARFPNAKPKPQASYHLLFSLLFPPFTAPPRPFTRLASLGLSLPQQQGACCYSTPLRSNEPSAPTATANTMPPRPPLRVPAAALALLLSCCLCLASAEPDADKAALLAFLAGVGRGAAARARINWPATPLACAARAGWTGVPCFLCSDCADLLAANPAGAALSRRRSCGPVAAARPRSRCRRC